MGVYCRKFWSSCSPGKNAIYATDIYRKITIKRYVDQLQNGAIYTLVGMRSFWDNVFYAILFGVYKSLFSSFTHFQ